MCALELGGRADQTALGWADCIDGGHKSIGAAVAAVAVEMAPVMVSGDAGGMAALELAIYDLAGQCARCWQELRRGVGGYNVLADQLGNDRRECG